jgi:transcription termination factor Rho
MRQRRRRPRGPRPGQPGVSSPGGPAASSPGPAPYGGAAPQDRSSGPRPGRRRRRRGGNRPISNASASGYQPGQSAGYEGGNGGGRPQPPPRRRRTRGRGNGGERRRGLEVLREMQQAGVALDPTERLVLELPPGEGKPPYNDRITGRAIDMIAPIGRGQRCLIVSPPKAGKTRILQCIAASIAHNHPDVSIYALLVDERPEEVTDFKRNTPANVIAASSDMSIEEHIETTEYAMNVVAGEVLEGKDVVLLLDSITRLARAYNANSDGSGRTMSGGLDTNAMQAPRQIFGAARKIEDGGSLTILGTALIDTGSRMDQVIFEEFKGTGNSEIYLSRELAERRIYPAIDIPKSGTRKEEKLYPPEIVQRMHLLRRGLAGMQPIEAMTKLLELLTKWKTNEEIFMLLKG